ncbi:ectonucleoside triphosphate diphosphohydrolase 5 isoform X3 [Atheta coriaria]|uniref:ectonucleoside triphosphate diphosphohydrolase 5 isoform X3 n=1 Tax=Dalotia coriaria TaxID=877792 RepID=UPI0031F40119
MRANDKENGRPAHPRKSKQKSRNVEASGIYKSLICLLVSGTLLLFVTLLYTDNDIPWHVSNRIVDNVAKSMGTHYPVYAVVLDAGSTGSRVLAFSFHRAIMNGDLILDKELFEYTKPGLSAFADDPAKAAASINNLIEKAKDEIPQEYWQQTVLILRATAGLRLLPAAKANKLLDTIRELFKKVPFQTREDSVEIMDGTDEGIFSWFTVNYLLHNSKAARTVAALDLGGGSTQVTFAPQTPATLKQREFIHDALLGQGKTQVFTNSYLGLGLMAARKEILTHDNDDTAHITSICVNPVIKNKKWHYGGTDYLISGPQENYPTKTYPNTAISQQEHVPIVDLDKCKQIVRDYVKTKATPLAELSNKRIFAFSYYFDRAAECGLIDETKGGSVTIEALKHAQTKVCEDPNTEQPFMCLDMSFIVSLLEDGLGLDNSTTINLYKKIDGHEISWALGAAYNLLHENLK